MLNDAPNRDASLAHALLRLCLGVNLFVHGIARLPNLAAFTAHLQQTMAKTWLPAPLVVASGYTIPFVELVTGALLLCGLFLRPALVLGSLLMIALTFGICLTQNWTIAAEQLIYMALFAALLATARYDRYSIDSWRARSSSLGATRPQLRVLEFVEIRLGRLHEIRLRDEQRLLQHFG